MSYRIDSLYSDLKKAGQKLQKELKHAYPEGSTVAFMLSSRQTRPSRGTVIFHHTDTLRVRMDSGTVKSVHLNQIIEY